MKNARTISTRQVRLSGKNCELNRSAIPEKRASRTENFSLRAKAYVSMTSANAARADGNFAAKSQTPNSV